jgi:hypothetical protein
VTAIRKITSLTFLLLGFTPLLFVLAITIQKHEIRERMEEEMEKGELQHVTVPENEVVWMDKHEIWVNNQMFDIHTRELRDGKYFFTGLYDAEETDLVVEQRKSAEQQRSKHQLLVKLFKSIPAYYNAVNEFLIPGDPAGRDGLFADREPDKPFHDILTPPPRFC